MGQFDGEGAQGAVALADGCRAPVSRDGVNVGIGFGGVFNLVGDLFPEVVSVCLCSIEAVKFLRDDGRNHLSLAAA